MATANTSTSTVSAGGIYPLSFNQTLTTIANGDILTDYTINHPFKVLDVRVLVGTAVTTGSKAATIGVEIGSTAVTGASIATTSATMTPKGKVLSATATANNVGNAGDKISLVASGVTAYSEGAAEIVVTIQNLAVS